MKQVKIIFSLIVGVLFLSSCSTYYYSTLGSADRIGDRTREGDFIQQNDTASVVYNFHGENAPVGITIYNKLNEPLYVDWGRSAIIIDGEATSYAGGALSYDEDETRFTSAQVEMIPPYSMIQRQPLTLDNFSFNKIRNKEYQQRALRDVDGEWAQLRVKEYTLDDSPLYFRSYVTLFTGGKEGTLPQGLVFERGFFISQLVKAGDLPPKKYIPMAQNSGDTFYVRYVTGRTLGYAIASIAVVVGVVALEVAVGPSDEY